jgi:acyl-ACP thioesterase
MQETIFDYPMDCETIHFNEFGAFKLASYQSLFASIAERHLNRYGLNIQTTLKTGYAWVLIGLTVEVVLPILEPMTLIANTWHSQREGIYFRREFVLKDQHGNVRFQGASFSVLIHLDKRTIFKDAILPFPVPFEPTIKHVVETTPRLTTILGLTPQYTLNVPSSYIDRLGHVNNVRYGDMVYDALTPDEQQRLHQLKRMQMSFSSELNTNDQVTILKGIFDQQFYFRGYHERKLKSSFDVKLIGL